MLSLLTLGIISLGIHGNVYPIKEESILKKINFSQQVNINLEEKLKNFAKINLRLPINKKLEVQEEKVIYTVLQDIKIGNKLIAGKGEKINVLERIKLRKVYVFLEGEMLPAFLDFAKKYPAVFLITKGNVYELQRKYPDLKIYMALPLIVERLGIDSVPTLVYQSQDKLVKVKVPWAEGKALLPF